MFNSAYRQQYIDNVLNTMHLPIGTENTYQYPEIYHGHPLVDASCMKKENVLNDDVLIIFIDRENLDDFQYIPLRKGKCVNLDKSAGVFYYTVRLLEECSVEDVTLFSSSFTEQMNGLLFNVSKDGDKSGCFAFSHSEIPKYTIRNDENSWRKTCDDLAKCSKMQVVYPIFTRFRLFDSHDNLMSVRKQASNASRYQLRMGKAYVAKIDYFIAYAEDNPESMYAELAVDVSPRKVSDELQVQILGAEAGRAEYKFFAEALCPNIALSYKISDSSHKEKTVKVANSKIRFNTVRSNGSRILIGIFAFSLLLSNYIMALPINSILDPTNLHLYAGPDSTICNNLVYKLASVLKSIGTLYPTLVGLLSSASTFFLVKLYSKREV